MRGRKRKRYTITVEQMQAFRKLQEYLQLDKIINNTCIFEPPTDYGQSINWHAETAKNIKADFVLWFNSWIKPNLEKLKHDESI